jgi:hypothetical protein
MAAKNGRSCPSTIEASIHARLAATAVCKMGHPPARNRPSALSNRRDTDKTLPFIPIRASTASPVIGHLLSTTTQINFYMPTAHTRI